MKKEFVPYEQALALKELGFDGFTFGLYHYKTKELEFVNSEGINSGVHISAPLYQQVYRWFRDKHSIHGLIEVDWDKGEGVNGYLVTIVTNEHYSDMDLNIFKTYEEAEQLCLEKLIEIVKEK